MCAERTGSRPGLIWSVLANRCPRCRKGRLFTSRNPYNLKTMMRMPEQCPVCGQPFELQTGFYFGTGYVSYGLAVGLTFAVFILYHLIFGLSVDDNSIFWCLGVNALVLILLQPIIQRQSRSIWIAFFVRYDPDWRKSGPAPLQPGV